jgi:hypothetical protein
MWLLMSPKSSYEILDKHTIVYVLCMKWTSHRIYFPACEIAMKDALSQNKSTIVLHTGNLYRSESDRATCNTSHNVRRGLRKVRHNSIAIKLQNVTPHWPIYPKIRLSKLMLEISVNSRKKCRTYQWSREKSNTLYCIKRTSENIKYCLFYGNMFIYF